jgi:putative ABC transport system permease protein
MALGLVRTVRLGVKSLLLNKLRSFLTAIGLLFGVCAVIAILAVGEGTAYEAQQQLKALGSSNILIRSTKPEASQQSSSTSMWNAQAYGLTNEIAERFEKTLNGLQKMVPARETVKEFRAGEQWVPSVAIGTTPDYADVVGMRIAEGRWLTQEDDVRRANVTVLGAHAAEKLFPLRSALGEAVRIGSDRFVVVGVLATLGRVSGSTGISLDLAAYIPISVSRAYFGEININRNGGSFSIENVQLHSITLKMEDDSLVEGAAAVVREMLSSAFPKKDYDLVVPLELLRQKEEQKRMFNIALGAIAGISLLVGGIGIMNVMLATVTERTREIGIRRALGAKKVHIISQFLVETIVLSVGGGILGVLAGSLLPSAIENFLNMKTILVWDHTVRAFLVSAIVGIVAGVYPAWRAANMDPVEALRHE